MNCPECGKEMEAGWLCGDWPLLWTPNEKKITKIRMKNEVELFRDIRPQAYLCRECQSVIVKYK